MTEDRVGSRKRISGQWILHLAAYLVTAAVAVAELLDLRFGPRFLVVAALLAAFAGTYIFVFRRLGVRQDLAFVPLVAWVSALALGVMIYGASPVFGMILFFVVCTTASLCFSQTVGLAWAGGAAAALLVVYVVRGLSDWPTVLVAGSGLFGFVAFATQYRRSQAARSESERLLTELSSAQSKLRDLAVVEERQRLAREMHDAVGHRLTAAAVLLEAGARLIPTDPLRATRMVETSRVQVRQGLDELRAAVTALRADVTGTLSLAEVLRALVDVFSQASEAKVSLSVRDGTQEPDAERKIVIVRTAQEALTNVLKHAAAAHVDLSVWRENGAFVLTCRDDGRGPTVSEGAALSKGFGLGNLRARAAAFGGRVELEPAPGGGSLLRLTLPAEGEPRSG